MKKTARSVKVRTTFRRRLGKGGALARVHREMGRANRQRTKAGYVK